MTNEEIKLLKNFITWQSLPFVDNLFTHEDEIIKKFDEWLRLNVDSNDRMTNEKGMTNEEALEILKSIEILSFRDKKRKYFMRDVWKAQKVAIKALEQQPCEDAISRKDTIEWLKKVTVTEGIEFKTGFEQILYDIEQMPSVNPEGENFTDEEKRIFLASVAREMRVCEQIDSEKTKVKLVPILERVKDKVLRSSLWKEVEE